MLQLLLENHLYSTPLTISTYGQASDSLIILLLVLFMLMELWCTPHLMTQLRQRCG